MANCAFDTQTHEQRFDEAHVDIVTLRTVLESDRPDREALSGLARLACGLLMPHSNHSGHRVRYADR